MSTDNDKMGTLRHQLSTLDELFKEVAIQYEAAAATLREGLLPDRTPGFQLDAARKVFTDTLSVLSDVGDTYGLAPVSQNASLPSALSYLNTVREAKDELERQQKLLSDAHAILAEAKMIAHEQHPEELENVQNMIIQSTNQLDNMDLDEAQQLVNGSHPLSKLISYTNHRDSLSDEEYDSFRDAIEESFGRAILRDIDRGRIALASTIATEAEAEIEDEVEADPYVGEERIDQAETQSEIIDIVDESEPEFEAPMMNGVTYENHTELEEPEPDVEVADTDEEGPEIINESSENQTEFFDETMHDEHEPFWPPSIEEDQTVIEETLNGEFEIDEDFNPEEDTITGRLS